MLPWAFHSSQKGRLSREGPLRSKTETRTFSFWVHPWAVAKSDGSSFPPIYPYALLTTVLTVYCTYCIHFGAPPIHFLSFLYCTSSPPRPFLFICILPALSFLQEPGLWIRAYHANRSMLRHDGLNCVLLSMLRETL